MAELRRWTATAAIGNTSTGSAPAPTRAADLLLAVSVLEPYAGRSRYRTFLGATAPASRSVDQG